MWGEQECYASPQKAFCETFVCSFLHTSHMRLKIDKMLPLNVISFVLFFLQLISTLF